MNSPRSILTTRGIVIGALLLATAAVSQTLSGADDADEAADAEPADGTASGTVPATGGEATPEPAAPASVAQDGEEIPAFFGRHGALTPRERQMAETAWSYFVERTQPDTGLANAVGGYPSTTLWDTASYISGLVAAHELGIIDKREFDSRATLLLRTLRNLELSHGEAPNKVYHTETGAMVNYANEPGEIGSSVLDIGRMLVWLRILGERYPYLANAVDNVPLRWNFCGLVGEDGTLFGTVVKGDGSVRSVQEGRLGYEEYAAKGFALWGFDVDAALAPAPVSYMPIFDVDVPYDGRDPRIYHNKNYVLTESYLLDGLELGWDLPWRDDGQPGVASQGWRAEFAQRIYLAQERRFEETGIITAKSEHQVDGAPYFVYDSIWADGYAWNPLDPTGTYQPDRAAIAIKAAIGMWALWDTPYTDLLFDTVADLSVSPGGFWEGLYENGNGTIPVQTANNNGIILAALLYKVQGPILQRLNGHTRVWDTAYNDGGDMRAAKCLPEPQDPVLPEPVRDDPPPLPERTVTTADFAYCRPIETEDGLAATACASEVRDVPPPSPQEVPPQLTSQASN